MLLRGLLLTPIVILEDFGLARKTPHPPLRPTFSPSHGEKGNGGLSIRSIKGVLTLAWGGLLPDMWRPPTFSIRRQPSPYAAAERSCGA